jgi:ABC-type glutathione transport system ATPase component
MALLEVDRLSITASIKDRETRIVRDLSFTLDEGDRFGIIGESGSGKTMTGLSLMGLLPGNCRASGTALLGGIALLSLRERAMRELRGRSIVFMPQSALSFLNPMMNVRGHLYEALRLAGARRMLREQSRTLLERAGFSDADEVLAKYPFELSGGMAQRVALALGLTASPRLVIADEPTRGIDDENAARYVAELDRAFSHAAVIIITHNIRLAERCRNIVVMRRGEVVETGNAQDVLRGRHPYTRSLISALPENGLHWTGEEEPPVIEEKAAPVV